MAELEKVKKGLHQHCEESLFDRCGECPYYEMDFGSWEENKFECRDELLSDAHELLKEQDIISPSDFKNEMEKISMKHDWEDRHLEADVLMGNLLDALGYNEGMKVFWAMERWYA